LQHLRQAQVVIGAQRTLALFAQTIAADALQRDITRSTQSADLQEGRAAMAEKRTPRFTGR